MNSICEQCLSNPNYHFETVQKQYLYLLVFLFSYPNMATANKQVATIFNKHNESMKSICQHCGSHFDYLATELTDTLKVSEGAEQTM